MMDNVKTGTLIRELRTSNNLTQKELAECLNITDKAVSKWERGLCAPDISLLEPLSKVLNTSITELIGCDNTADNEHINEMELGAMNMIDYAKEEIKHKTQSMKRKFLVSIAVCITIILILLFVMCIRIATAVTSVAWITFINGEENINPAYVVFTTGMPYMLGVIAVVIIATLFWKKAKI